MFGINGAEFLVLAVLVFFVIGPERMPEYAAQLRDLVKTARRTALDAQNGVKETLGPEFSEINWRAYDPRQYDPRRIVREALQEDEAEERALRARAAGPSPTNVNRLAEGQHAPYDQEAT